MNESRTGVYEYVRGLIYGTVTENVYSMNEPQELTESDTNDGFVVISVGDMFDESEFSLEAYGWVRVFIEAYVPPMSRGRVDIEKYKTFETSINEVLRNEIETGEDEHYSIQEDGVLSMEDIVNTNANNVYYRFIKSFIVNLD